MKYRNIQIILIVTDIGEYFRMKYDVTSRIYLG